MNRLTKKFNGEYYHKDANTIVFNNETDYNAIQKLGKLEDLEEELGCPLAVVFKAIYKGIKTKKHYEICSGQEFEKYIKVAEPHLTFTSVELDWLDENKYFQDYANQWCFHFDGWERLVKLSDYQKTWWLKGEKENV